MIERGSRYKSFTGNEKKPNYCIVTVVHSNRCFRNMVKDHCDFKNVNSFTFFGTDLT